MARQPHTVEKFIRITAENSDAVITEIHFGSAAPGLDSDTNAAPVGSVYHRTNGELYQKTTAGSGSDKWTQQLTNTLLSFRTERVLVATNDADPGNGVFTGPFGDDDGGAPAIDNTGFAVNDHILFDADGTPTLRRVSAVSGTDITLADPVVPTLTDGNAWLVRHYLPDSPASQELSAFVFYNGATLEKVGDINWDFADGINIAAGYTAGSGDPGISDTVQSALQKIDGNVDAIDTRQGLAQGATSFGTFTGGQNILPNNSTTKAILQAVATEIDTYKRQSAVTAQVTLDEVPIANFEAVEWLVHIEDDTTPTLRQLKRVMALHDGTSVAVDTMEKLKTGNTTDTIVVDINAGNLRLRVSASSATTFKSVRRHVIATIN